MTKTIYLINHSHTDIGYTDKQEIIMEYHIDFIRDAMAIIKAGIEEKDHSDYIWTCENYWQIELFLENASAEEVVEFEAYIELGNIDFSKNYLNMTELVDPTILDTFLKKGDQYAAKFTRKFDSAMTADINGYSWGFSNALLNNGVNNLFACVHGHHGIYPLFQNQLPFWWESQTGEKLLVWSGEHYHFGNELSIVPNAQNTYQIRDEFMHDTNTDQLLLAEKRIFGYLAELEERGYDYSFIPLMISGFISDNAGPNEAILTFIEKWNQKFGDQVQLKMSGLNEFFEVLHQEDLTKLPVHAGDWTDWWADGVGSTPAPTKIYKGAVREHRLIQALKQEGLVLDEKNEALLAEAEKNLMMYAEHTWGYSSSVTEPWNTLVNELDYRKAAYATNGSQGVSRYLNRFLAKHHGYAYPRANRKQAYKAINPYENTVQTHCTFLLEHWENIEGARLSGDILSRIEIYEVETGLTYPCQIEGTARAYEMTIVVTLEPKEEKIFALRLKEAAPIERNYTSFVQGAEGVRDLVYEGKLDDYHVETEHFNIDLSNREGLGEIIYKATGVSILKDTAIVPAFFGVYEKTPLQTNPYEERRRMGRNRKGKNAERDVSRIKDIYIKNRGTIYTIIVISCELAGTQMYDIHLKVYQNLPKIEATIRIQKNNEWAPENLYVSLPFALGEELFVKKSGSVIRPGMDQLPGTNMEFYLIDTGSMTFDDQKNGLGICIQDAPLITLGDLKNHPIHLQTPEKGKEKNQEVLYSWIMNNYWETNFKVDLSGFYEFSYTVFVQDGVESTEAFDQTMDQINQGIIALPI